MEASSGPNTRITLIIENSADISEEAYKAWINADANLETAEKTTEETICQARMNRRDDGIELDDNDDEEDLEEKPPSAQEILQALRTLRRSDQYCAESFDENYSYVGWLFCVSWRKNHFLSTLLQVNGALFI
ncbi:hypothetical protein AVEN_116813-1 [Araneus ventricosus]|uniref:Uncharacterized protein n=1 Tax=Araneus ventricosus TaxID=182803 RepID=A0A4Y2PCZ0_ARAVE|nr:hypothetical protein AVEN_116813-1 [Araneus ventricosus]